MFNSKSKHAEEFISDEEILSSLAYAKQQKDNTQVLDEILKQAETFQGLDYRQVAVLLECVDAQNRTVLDEIHRIAMKIKQHIYGNRIVFCAALSGKSLCQFLSILRLSPL